MRVCSRRDELIRARIGRPALLLCLAALLCGGCQVTSEDITRWKGTEKGPGKLRAVLHDAEAAPELRAQAAVALIDIRRGDEVRAEIEALPESSRRPLLQRILPALADVVQKGPPDVSPTRAQIEAKDALFRLRGLGSPEDRTLVDETLVAWTTADLIGRMSAGSFGTEQIITTVGNRAQGALLAILSRATIDSPSLLPAASLLGRVGDREAKGHGAELLIKLLQPVLSGTGGKEVPPQRQVDEVLRSLGLLGGPAAGKFLADLAARGPVGQRGQALAALRETGDPVALDLALRIAWDRKEPGSLREAAFAYLEKVGEIAVNGLCKIIADPRDPSDQGDVARFRAVEAALSAGGGAAIARVLDALPVEHAYGREDFISFIVHQITPLGSSALPQLREALKARSWVARSAALMALSEMGKIEADQAAILALAGDGEKLRGKGWQVATVGELAKEQAGHMRDKRPDAAARNN
jgi:hypothetical protein